MGRWLNTHINGGSTKLWKEGVTTSTWEGGALGGKGGRKEPDTTIIAGASSWRGTFTQCGGIPRMMAGRMVVAARLHNNNMQPGGGAHQQQAHQQTWLTHWRSHHSWVNFQRVDLGGAWIGSARRGLVATLEEGVFESSCKGESERRKWKSYIILSSFLILWFHYFGPVLEKVSDYMKVLANLK